MKNKFLIYINVIGKDYKDNFIYEFIFSDTLKDVDGNQWDAVPASGQPDPPNDVFINSVGRIETELLLDVIQNSTIFAVWDAIDGVVALAWENLDELETYPESRLIFKYGETMEDVETKLYERDLILNYILKNGK
jgi:hypothetical protein